jgi:hypothetical protein
MAECVDFKGGLLEQLPERPLLMWGLAGVEASAPLTVIDGKTNQQHYVLSSKLSVIGKSEMASIRLKRWFAPRTAASIQ